MLRDCFIAYLVFATVFVTILPNTVDAVVCGCNINNGKGQGGSCFNPNTDRNRVCRNGYGNWGTCVPASGCPAGNVGNGPPGSYQSLGSDGNFTVVEFMQPLPTWSYVYECQNSSLFLAVYNMSLRGYNHLNQVRNLWVNTVTCVTAVPAQQSGGFYFDVNTYNSCDNAGMCGNCAGCNCSCRVEEPWWWQCCYDPCFACSHCCDCPTANAQTWIPGNLRNFDQYSGTCLQCNHDGWCASPNGQMLTPTVCQFALWLSGPGNRLDYEELASSNFSYQVRIFQRTIGCHACNSEAVANLTVYVRDCNEWPIFDRSITATQLYQYDGYGTIYKGPALNILAWDDDVYNTMFNTVDLNVQRVTLNFCPGGTRQMNPAPWYIQNSRFVGSNMAANANASVLMFDVARCGSALQSCLDMFRYTYTGCTPPIFTVWVTAVDGGGLVSTYSYSVTIINTPDVPEWVNMPATVNIVEGTVGGAGWTQIFPMTAIVGGVGTRTWGLIDVNPAVDYTTNVYFGTNNCNPAAASAVQCRGLYLTNQVVSTTFVWARQKMYNITVWFTNTVGTVGSNTISSSVIVNILQLIYQPTLLENNVPWYLKENVTGMACIYNITKWTQPNGHTFFLYSLTTTPAHNALYMIGSAICYDGGRQTNGAGTTIGWIFNYGAGPILYTLRVRVDNPLSTMPAPTFTLLLNIINVEDPPLLTVPVFQNIPETATSWNVNITCTKEANQQAVKFELINQSTAANNTMWYISAQSSTYAGIAGDATITANPAIVPAPMFNYSRTSVIYQEVICYTNQYTVRDRIIFFIQRINTPPYFLNLPNMTSLAEATTLYIPFFTVSTADRENDNRLVYFCQPPSTTLTSYHTPSTNRFYIDPVMGIITTYIPTPASRFNFYTTPIYTLTICAVDSPPSFYTPMTGTTTLIIYIVLNQTAPTFVTPPSGGGATVTPNINENVRGQRYIYTLTATDREGDRVYYNVTDVRPTYNKALRIPWTSNLLEYNQDYATTNPMFNNTINPVYYVIVEATDLKNTPTSTTTLTVSINYVDLPAVWTSLPAFVSVREDVYWGPTDLLIVGAKDPNPVLPSGLPKYPVTIALQNINPASGSTQIYFNTTTRAVGYVMNPNFGYGVVNTYVLTFTAWNTINPTITSSVVIQILPIPTGPQLNNTGTVYIYENVTSGQTLWDMRARDNNTRPADLKYSLFDINPNSGLTKFVVTANGIIRSVDNPKFNFQTQPVYVLRATVTNNAGLAATFTLTVSILDCPQMPLITNLPAFANVKEGARGSLLGGLYNTKCVDPDNRPLSWNYNVLPNTGFSYFNITSTGVVQITQYSTFDYLDQPYYYVVVYCSNGAYTATGTLSVVVLWTTSTTSTTPGPRTTIPDEITTTTVVPAGDLLTPEQIGAIVGSLLGALCLAGAAYGIARYLQRKARQEGITKNMKKPFKAFNSYKI